MILYLNGMSLVSSLGKRSCLQLLLQACLISVCVLWTASLRSLKNEEEHDRKCENAQSDEATTASTWYENFQKWMLKVTCYQAIKLNGAYVVLQCPIECTVANQGTDKTKQNKRNETSVFGTHFDMKMQDIFWLHCSFHQKRCHFYLGGILPRDRGPFSWTCTKLSATRMGFVTPANRNITE